mmetsp:Transcript_5760/g.4950  ORF Transcript_5760/g.4950 Transcript_5760/m.4950 type:complete len:83 (+) Transcript_5760:2-250(+)
MKTIYQEEADKERLKRHKSKFMRQSLFSPTPINRELNWITSLASKLQDSSDDEKEVVYKNKTSKSTDKLLKTSRVNTRRSMN